MNFPTLTTPKTTWLCEAEEMNLPRIYLIAILLLASGVGASSQDLPRATLISEFGLLPCGHIHAQADAFAEEIKADAMSRAVILIYPPIDRPEASSRLRKQISSFLQNRGLNTNLFSFYKAGKSDQGIKTQLWKLGQGVELPFTDALLWNEDEPNTSRAFIFGYEDEINICPTFVPGAFAKLILENPGSRGHVVVKSGKDSTIDKFWFAEQMIKDLVDSHGVPRKSLRLLFTKGKEMTVAEFWFVPARKE